MSDTKLIYIVRHGETDYNRQNIIQGGGIDSNINEKGQQQAAQFFNAYRSFGFDAVYTSQLKRAIQSVQLFIDAGLPHTALADLNELNWGIFEGEPITPELKVVMQNIVATWRNGDTHHAPEQGESPEQAAVRIRRAFQYIVNNTNENKVLVCIHGRLLRIVMCVLNNQPVSNMDKYPIENLGLYAFSYDYKTDTYTPAIFNDTTHLKNDGQPIHNSMITG